MPLDRMTDSEDRQDAEDAISPGRESPSHYVSPMQQKRKRYTPTACDECKRRKVKCDGKIPCHRCARVSLSCVYTQRDSNHESRHASELKKMNQKIALLQEQVTLLISKGAAGLPTSPLQTQLTPESHSVPAKSNLSEKSSLSELGNNSRARRKPNPSKHLQYMGPTSSAFSFGVAKNSLQRMGIQPERVHVDDGRESHLTTPAKTPPHEHDLPPHRDPLLSISRDDAVRLIETYEEESGTIYSFLDINIVTRSAHDFYESISATQGPSVSRRLSAENEGTLGGTLNILKLVIAIGLVIEARGLSDLSARLLDDVESGFDSRPCGSSTDLNRLQVLTLMSIHQFHSDEEVLAWRTIGLATRAALEMGLHRRESQFSKFHDAQQRLWANKVFWCIYVLDRRWSFGTGLPFAFHDEDIDPDLPEPIDSHPFILTTMVAYGRIGSRVWKNTSSSSHSISHIKKEKTAYLDFQVQQWQNSISPELQLQVDSDYTFEGYSRSRNRLRALFYLRANQMRLLIYRRTLLTPATIVEDPGSAQLVVDVAKDTIRVLDKLNRLTDIYASQQTCFNYFLVSALAVLFLAVCHATTRFNENCRKEFFMALDLIRGFSARSHVARKLWMTIKHLKVVGPKLGIFPHGPQPPKRSGTQQETYDEYDIDRHNHANGIMSNTHPLGVQKALPTPQELNFEYPIPASMETAVSPTYSFPMDGNLLSNELTDLFEAIEPRREELTLNPRPNDLEFDFFDYGASMDLSKSLWGLF